MHVTNFVLEPYDHGCPSWIKNKEKPNEKRFATEWIGEASVVLEGPTISKQVKHLMHSLVLGVEG